MSSKPGRWRRSCRRGARRAPSTRFLGRGQARAVNADQRGGDVLGRLLGEQARARARDPRRRPRPGRAGRRAAAHGRRRESSSGVGAVDPLGLDPRAAQHHLDALAARVGDDQHRGALLARRGRCGPSGAASASASRGSFDVDDQAEAAAGRSRARRRRSRRRRGRGRRAAPAARGCARSGYARPTARRPRSRARSGVCVQVADIVARGAEQDRGLGLVEAQQVDHRMLDVGRGDGDRLVGDVAMAASSPTVEMRSASRW